MAQWNRLNEEGKDRMLDVWADAVRAFLVAAQVDAKQQELEMPYHCVDEFCQNCGFPRPRWSAVKERMIARGMPLCYRNFFGYYWGDREGVGSILQHPMYIVTGLFKGVRSTTVAMSQAGYTPLDVSRYISGTGVAPDVFCRTLSTWDGVESLPKEFEVLLLGPGSDDMELSA